MWGRVFVASTVGRVADGGDLSCIINCDTPVEDTCGVVGNDESIVGRSHCLYFKLLTMRMQ